LDIVHRTAPGPA